MLPSRVMPLPPRGSDSLLACPAEPRPMRAAPKHFRPALVDHSGRRMSQVGRCQSAEIKESRASIILMTQPSTRAARASWCQVSRPRMCAPTISKCCCRPAIAARRCGCRGTDARTVDVEDRTRAGRFVCMSTTRRLMMQKVDARRIVIAPRSRCGPAGTAAVMSSSEPSSQRRAMRVCLGLRRLRLDTLLLADRHAPHRAESCRAPIR